MERYYDDDLCYIEVAERFGNMLLNRCNVHDTKKSKAFKKYLVKMIKKEVRNWGAIELFLKSPKEKRKCCLCIFWYIRQIVRVMAYGFYKYEEYPYKEMSKCLKKALNHFDMKPSYKCYDIYVAIRKNGHTVEVTYNYGSFISSSDYYFSSCS